MVDDTPIYESLFSLQLDLCERFPAMTPLSLRKEKAREVFLLINRYSTYSQKEQKNIDSDGTKIIRRPAGDDWF